MEYRKAFQKEFSRIVAFLRAHKLLKADKNTAKNNVQQTIGRNDPLFIRKSTSTLNSRLC